MYRKKYLLENRLLYLLISRHSFTSFRTTSDPDSEPKAKRKGKNLCDDEILRPSAKIRGGLPQNDKNGILQQSHLDWIYILETAKTEDIFYPVYRELLVLDEEKSFFPEEARARFSQLYYAYISQSVLLSKQISLILDKIEAKGIKTLLLKGPAIDSLIYKEDYLRPRLDLDLAVKKEGFPALEALLFDLGYSFDNETERQYPITEYLNSRIYIHKQNNFIPVHAHRHIINNLYLLALGDMDIDLERVWQEAGPFKKYNYIFCLKPELHLLYVCEHALKHNYERLIFIYEIDRLVDFYGMGKYKILSQPLKLHKEVLNLPTKLADEVSCKNKFDWDKLLCLAREFKLSFVVYYGLFFASRVFSTDIPVNILNALKPKRISLGEKIFVKCTLKRKRIFYLSYLVYFAARKGPSEKIKFLLRTVFPPQFTVTGYMERIRRLIRLIFKS